MTCFVSWLSVTITCFFSLSLSHIFLIIVFICLGCAGSSLLGELFSSCSEQGRLSSCGAWVSHGGGLPCWGARAPGHTGFGSCGRRAQGLQSPGSRAEATGPIVVAHGLSCSVVCGIFPDQGSNPCLLHSCPSLSSMSSYFSFCSRRCVWKYLRGSRWYSPSERGKPFPLWAYRSNVIGPSPVRSWTGSELGCPDLDHLCLDPMP